MKTPRHQPSGLGQAGAGADQHIGLSGGVSAQAMGLYRPQRLPARSGQHARNVSISGQDDIGLLTHHPLWVDLRKRAILSPHDVALPKALQGFT